MSNQINIKISFFRRGFPGHCFEELNDKFEMEIDISWTCAELQKQIKNKLCEKNINYYESSSVIILHKENVIWLGDRHDKAYANQKEDVSISTFNIQSGDEIYVDDGNYYQILKINVCEKVGNKVQYFNFCICVNPNTTMEKIYTLIYDKMVSIDREYSNFGWGFPDKIEYNSTELKYGTNLSDYSVPICILTNHDQSPENLEIYCGKQTCPTINAMLR